MKVLFIGGTGIISSACSERAIEEGFELYHLNRGKTASIRKIEGVKTIIGDIRDTQSTKTTLDGHYFDVVVDFIAFTPAHIQQDIEWFRGKTDQFVFISSASAYQTPPGQLPITEDTILDNPFWEYSRLKIACEEELLKAHDRSGFPFTIVRPSHTYDKTLIPLQGGYTVMHRMKKGLPVVVHGDGTSVWTLTNHRDFAIGFVGLLGKQETIGEAYHITSDEWLTWNQIYITMAKAMGVEAKLVHIPSKTIAKYDQQFAEGLLGDKSHSMIFDNTKIKKQVPEFNAKIPFAQGAKEIVQWYEANDDQFEADPHLNRVMEKMIADHYTG